MADRHLWSVVDMSDATCRAPDCGKPIKIKGAGLCGMHYERQRRGGTIADPRRRDARRAKVLAQTAIRENGCVEWTGRVAPNGYGHVHFDGRDQGAHRVVYNLLVGPIPEGLEPDHTCHNTDPTCPGGPTCRHRRCVSPEHLEPVTHRENTLRSPIAVPAINARKTHCKWGHPFDEKNTGRQTGGRSCRRCAVLATQRWQAKHGRS